MAAAAAELGAETVETVAENAKMVENVPQYFKFVKNALGHVDNVTKLFGDMTNSAQLIRDAATHFTRTVAPAQGSQTPAQGSQTPALAPQGPSALAPQAPSAPGHVVYELLPGAAPLEVERPENLVVLNGKVYSRILIGNVPALVEVTSSIPTEKLTPFPGQTGQNLQVVKADGGSSKFSRPGFLDDRAFDGYGIYVAHLSDLSGGRPSKITSIPPSRLGGGAGKSSHVSVVNVLCIAVIIVLVIWLAYLVWRLAAPAAALTAEFESAIGASNKTPPNGLTQ